MYSNKSRKAEKTIFGSLELELQICKYKPEAERFRNVKNKPLNQKEGGGQKHQLYYLQQLLLGNLVMRERTCALQKVFKDK